MSASIKSSSQTKETIVVTFDDSAECQMQNTMGKLIRPCKRPWAYEASRIPYIVCQITFVFSRDWIGRENATDTELWHERWRYGFCMAPSTFDCRTKMP